MEIDFDKLFIDGKANINFTIAFPKQGFKFDANDTIQIDEFHCTDGFEGTLEIDQSTYQCHYIIINNNLIIKKIK